MKERMKIEKTIKERIIEYFNRINDFSKDQYSHLTEEQKKYRAERLLGSGKVINGKCKTQ
jgi:hypothetical protein